MEYRYLIDKRTARDWTDGFHSKNELSVKALPEARMVNVLDMSAALIKNYLSYLASQAKDDTERTELMATASAGIIFAATDTLLITEPPKCEAPTDPVRN